MSVKHIDYTNVLVIILKGRRCNIFELSNLEKFKYRVQPCYTKGHYN